MAVRIADTLKQQNDLTSFPVAYADGIWLDKNKGVGTADYSDLQTMYNNDELGGGGSSIQVDTLPIASEDELGRIYQYIGGSGTYKNGFFYRCDYVDNEYVWTEIVYGSNLQAGDGIDITDDTISVVDRLVETDTMPTASASLLDATRLFVGTTTSDFIKGGIYECQEVVGSDPTEYAWVLISTNPLEAGKGITIKDDVISADTNVFTGTLDEWDALTPAEQAEYDFIATPDEAVEDIADAIIDGDMRAITSNAVAQVVPSDASSSNKLATVADITKYFVISNSDVNVGESFYTNVTNSFEVFKIVADTIFNDIDASGKLTPYVGHATAYTTDDSGYPNIGVSTYIASSCWGANGHPYIRMRIFADGGNEYIFRRSQDGAYTLAEVPEVKSISNPFTINTSTVTSVEEIETIKQGRIVQFRVYLIGLKNIEATTWMTLGTVPDTIKPVIETPLIVSDCNMANNSVLARITTAGKIQVWGTNGLNGCSSRFSATYFSAE